MAQRELIHRPNLLADRIGPRARVFTADLVRRAEKALEQISVLFGSWLLDDIDRLERVVFAEPLGSFAEDWLKQFRRRVTQLRASGDAFDFPIISRLASSLQILIEGANDRQVWPAKLIDAHMKAIRAAARDQIRSPDDPIARATCDELEAQSRKFMAAL